MAYTNNMQIKSGLTIQYFYTNKVVNVTGWSALLFQVTRVATKQYSIVGIGGYDEAKRIANEKIQQYTRTKKGWYFGPTQPEYTNSLYCVASVTPVHTSGCMWQVDINVNDKEEVWVFRLPSDLSSLFNVNQDYDEPPAE